MGGTFNTKHKTHIRIGASTDHCQYQGLFQDFCLEGGGGGGGREKYQELMELSAKAVLARISTLVLIVHLLTPTCKCQNA